MDSCIICYEDKNLILPQNCKCKIMMHKQCLDKMIDCLDIDCPSCRHKIIKKNEHINHINYVHYSRPSLKIFFCFLIILCLIFILLISIIARLLIYIIVF